MPRFKIVLTDFGDRNLELEEEEFRAAGLEYELVRLDARVPDELIPAVADADALMVQWCKVNRAVIGSMRRCRVISRYGIGVDMVDLQAAGEHGIMVANVPDFCIEEVSTHTIGFLLALNRHMWLHHAHVRGGGWGGVPGGPPSRLQGQVLGVVGLGAIGRSVAQKASCLGLRVVAADPYLAPDVAARSGAELVGLDELLRISDYVSLHCPLIEETHHLIDAPQLALMKPTACLINMARGPVVNQSALCEALVQGRIKGAALDVLEQEPPAPDEPILKLENVMVTPHSSSWSADAAVQLRRDVARNVVAALRGEMPRSVVNRKWLRPREG